MHRLIYVILIIALFSGCSSNNTNDASKSNTHDYIESSIEIKQSSTISQAEVIPVDLPNNSVKANFVKPDYFNYKILNTVYDKISETYAIIYAVSNHNVNVMPWQTYQGCNSNINIQIFDKNGGFVKLIMTELDPLINSKSEPIQSVPCVFNDSMLTFFSGFITQEFIFFDTINEKYTSVPAHIGATDNEDTVLRKRGENANSYTYSLYHKNKLISSINLIIDDYNFNEGDEFETDKFFTFNSSTKIATNGNDKLTITLNFNNQTWDVKRDYKKQHLEQLITISPNGQWDIYAADSGGVGDACWADIVAVETTTGKITYLTKSSNNSLVFGSNNLMLLNHTDSLELINVEKAAIIDKNFAIDCEKKDCYINGIAYDKDNEWFLVTWRSPQQGYDGDWSKKLPIILDIYNTKGTLIKSLDTGFATLPFYQSWVNPLTLELDYKGSVSILDRSGVLGSVKYN